MKNRFDAMLRNMTGAEMEKCAGELLKKLSGENRTAGAASAADNLKQGGTKAQNERQATGENAEAEQAAGENLLTRLTQATAAIEAAVGITSGEAAAEKARRTAFSGEMRDNAGELPKNLYEPGESAKPANLHRRYENSAGGRKLEMSRVSDFFNRDSRRYDTGFKNY